MAGDTKPEKVLNVKSDASKSAKDLEAEIAAAAHAISELETVDGETVSKPRAKKTRKSTAKKTKSSKTKKPATKKTSSTKKASSKKTPPKKSASKKTTTKKTVPEKAPTKTAATPAAKKPTPKKTAKPRKPTSVVPNQDVRPAQPKPKVVKKAVVTSSSDGAPSAVKVTVKPKSANKPLEKKVEEATAPQIMNHQGKTLKPISTNTDSVNASKPEIPAKPAKAVTSKVKVKEPIHTPKPYEVIKTEDTETKHRPQTDESVEEPQQKEAPTTTPARHKRTPHVARVYDTQTYHLPLSVDHHHRRAQFPRWAQALLLLIGLAGAVIGAVVFDLFDLN